MNKSFEEAIKTIERLEQENIKLKKQNDELIAELEHYRNRKKVGRKKHNETWQSSYNDFVSKYENNMTILEIVAEGNISRRTAYRYKAYYDKQKAGIS